MITAAGSERRQGSAAPGAAPRRSRRLGRAATPYALILPAAFIYLLFTVYPIFRQFDISFFNWHIFPGATNPFVGFSNYTAVFRDPIVRTAALNTLLYVVITVPVQMVIGLFAAAVLSDRLPGGWPLARADLHPGRHLVGDRLLRLRLHLQRSGRRGKRVPQPVRRATRCTSTGWRRPGPPTR